MKKALTVILTLLAISVWAQELPNNQITEGKEHPSLRNFLISSNDSGLVKFFFSTHSTRDPLGITVVGASIIISSTDNHGGNYFEEYTFDGQFVKEAPQPTNSTYGYRDLAFDGKNILGSDGNSIYKIDPTDFSLAGQIINEDNSVHRGLAFDYTGNVIYSTNWGSGKLLKIDAATGATLKDYGKTTNSPYGIAFDKYSNPSFASLWFAVPSKYGTFRLARVDTTNGKINYLIDVSSELPDSSLSAGLEIWNNIPAFPGRIIALAVDQHNHRVNFIDITDAEYLMPTEFELAYEFAGQENGIETRGMARYLTYLYSIENGYLSIYDVENDPLRPAYVTTDTSIGHLTGGSGGNKIFVNNDMAFISVTGPYPEHNTNDFTTVESYLLTDPQAPQYAGRVDLNYPVRNAEFYMSQIYFLHGLETNKLSVVQWDGSGQLQLLHQYLLYSDTGEPAYAVDAEIDWSHHLMFLSYFYFSSRGYQHTGIWIYDVQDPDNIKRISTLSTTAGIPLVLQRLPNYRLAVAYNDEESSKLSCYDYSDFQSLKYLNYINVSTANTVYDMKKMYDNQLVVSVPEEGIKLFYWDDTHNSFLTGPALNLSKPADIVTYYGPAATVTKTNFAQQTMAGDYETYLAVNRGESSEFNHVVHGNEKVGIIKSKRPRNPGEVSLTMKISPPEAASNGCSVIPAPGEHNYKEGTEINLYASENPKDGWYFTKWTGDASGTDLIQHLVMDGDKTVIGNFDQIKLTVSGMKQKKTICPETGTFYLPVTVCASEVDDWQLQKISLRSGGTGDEVEDISSVLVHSGGNSSELLFSGKYNADDGTIDLEFTPPISIKAGSCITFFISYEFSFDPVTYASDTTKSFYAETFGTVAKPVHYEDGLIQGKAIHDTLTFAKVINSQGYGFSKIQDALDDNTTRSGDTCLVCPGEYYENIVIGSPVGAEPKKGIKLISKEGPGRTTIHGRNDFPTIIVFPEESEINGFKIKGELLENKFDGILIHSSAKNSIIQNNEILNFGWYGIEVSEGGNRILITNNIFKHNKGAHIKLEHAKYMHIRNNIFAENASGSYDIYDENGFHNTYSGNIFSVDKAKLYFDYWMECVFSKNSSGKNKNSNYHLELNHGYSNRIEKNNNLGIELNNCYKNEIYENELRLVYLDYGSSQNIIYNNLFKNGMGLVLLNSKSMKRNSYENKIINNSIENCKESITKSYYISCNTDLLIKDNYFINGYPLLLSNSGNVKIINNTITASSFSGMKIEYSNDILFQKNQILDNWDVGLKITDTKNIDVIGNTFRNNSSGIVTENVQGGYFSNNILINNKGNNTGFHAFNSDINLRFNQITNNAGGGIKLAEGTTANIQYNNIFSNETVQAENSDGNQSPDISNNYWGSQNGPAPNDIAGNFLINGYLTEPVSLVLTVPYDTVNAKAGATDSTAIIIDNYVNENDNIQLNISDTKGWVLPLSTNPVNLNANGKVAYLKYKIPQNAGDNSIDEVTIKGISLADTSITKTVNFVLATYTPQISMMKIFPDSLTMNFSDTVKFTAIVQDQHHDTVNISPVWTATRGTISDSGYFASDSTAGVIEIRATLPGSNLSATTHVFNTNQEVVLNRVEIYPDSVKLSPGEMILFRVRGFNQFEFPFKFEKKWTASGGEIIDKGFYVADSIEGVYNVIVSDTSGTLSDTARVIIEKPTLVEKGEIPTEFSLSQNYPNPFNPSTTIRYSLKSSSLVKLEIFNILGQRIMMPLNKFMKPGIYELKLNFANYSSGVYFYRLIANGEVINVKKMILLK